MKLRPKAHFCTFLGYVPSTTKQWRLWYSRLRRVLIGAIVKFDENGFGDQQSEHPNLLGEVNEGQVDWHSTPAPREDHVMAEVLPRDIEMSPPMPATTLPVAEMDSLLIKEPPEEVSNTGEAFKGHLELLELDPISSASLPETEFEDTIVLAPPPRVNMASSWLNEVLACESGTKTSMALIANAGEEPQSFKEALSNSDKWRAAIKSELDPHIKNRTGKLANFLQGDVRSYLNGSSKLK